MLATSKSVQFPGRAIIKLSSHQHQWLASGYDPEIGHFRGG